MAKHDNPRWITQAVERAGAGWRWRRTASNHFQIFTPQGSIILVSTSNGDHRNRANAEARLRRAGLNF